MQPGCTAIGIRSDQTLICSQVCCRLLRPQWETHSPPGREGFLETGQPATTVAICVCPAQCQTLDWGALTCSFHGLHSTNPQEPMMMAPSPIAHRWPGGSQQKEEVEKSCRLLVQNGRRCGVMSAVSKVPQNCCQPVCFWRPMVKGPTLEKALKAALSAARIALRSLRQPQLRLTLPPRALSPETSHQLIHHVICLHT